MRLGWLAVVLVLVLVLVLELELESDHDYWCGDFLRASACLRFVGAGVGVGSLV